MHLHIKPNDDNVKVLYDNHTTYHLGDAGLDLFCPEELVIPAKSLGYKVNLGIRCEALNNEKTEGVSFKLYARSSTGSKTPLRLANNVGIIDKGYRGPLIACFDNLSEEDFLVEKNMRLVQICGSPLQDITFELVEELSDTTRGVGGFGSTGI
jgi:dUTP pyrophosphatase